MASRFSRRPLPNDKGNDGFVTERLTHVTDFNNDFSPDYNPDFIAYNAPAAGYRITPPQVPPKDPITSERRLENSPERALLMDASGSGHRALGRLSYAIRWIAVVLIVGGIISIPMILTRQTLDVDDTGDVDTELEQLYQQQYQNLVFWIFSWVLATWIAACLFHLVALTFPYVFRWLAKYLNPAHRRYWRVFGAMKWPITLLGGMIGSYIAYALLIYGNDDLTANYDFDDLNNITSTGVNPVTFDDSSKQTVFLVQDIINNVLFNVILWVALWFIEKCVIVYISVHYHTRSHFNKIQEAKEMISALVTLYDASSYLHPLHGDLFRVEDTLIHDARDSSDGRLTAAGKVSRVASTGGKHLTSALGYLVSSDQQTHWFRPGSSYAVVSRALNHPASAAALAKRIWVSLTADGQNGFTCRDIVAALGPHRHEEAEHIFRLLDEDENDDIRLSEFVPTVVDVGTTRRNIYSGMHDIDHALNTFDWIICIILAVAMIFFILVSWVPQISALRDNLALVVVGGAFIVGRIGHEFFAGAIFVFFKHAFDVADHVRLFNSNEANHVACIVKRISLLYVVFERTDDGTTMQIPNDKLNTKRIENLTRSGINRQIIDLPIDFGTTFKDIELLRKELTDFVMRKENSRDYRPWLDVRIKSIHDMSRMELQCSIWHKSNWRDEQLRAARSSKFLCALVAAIRKVPINKPGGGKAKTGDEGNPAYTVMVSEEDAAKKRAEEKTKQLSKRMDYVAPPEPSEDANSGVDSPEEMLPRTTAELAELEMAQRRKEEEAAAAAAKEAADKEKKEIEKELEEGARQLFTETRLVPVSRTSTMVETAASPQPLSTRSFSFISGRERGSRRTTVGPGQSTPFYNP